MKKSIVLRYVIVSILLAASLVVLRSSSKSKAEPQPPCCKKNTECLPKEKNSSSPSNMVWETFTRQFVVATGLRY